MYIVARIFARYGSSPVSHKQNPTSWKDKREKSIRMVKFLLRVSSMMFYRLKSGFLSITSFRIFSAP